MAVRSDIDDLEIVIRRRNGHYLARIPQIGLYATGDSLPNAVAALDDKKHALKEELIKANALDDVIVSPPGQRRVLPALLLFAAKAAVVLVAILYAVAYSERAFERQVDQLRKVGGASFWSGLEQNIARAAAPGGDLPEAKKQELLANIHVIVERWRPFVREAQLLFSDAGAVRPDGK
jgi:hypothetical protein